MRPFAELSTDGNREVGREVYINGILNNNESPQGLYLRTYANYLLNGGSKEDWLDLTEEEVALMTITMKLERQEIVNTILENISKMFNNGEQ